MIRIGETIHSALPQDIPWFLPDHFLFFAVLYAVLGVIFLGLGIVFVKSVRETANDDCGHH
jgi:hypothetical protein